MQREQLVLVQLATVGWSLEFVVEQNIGSFCLSVEKRDWVAVKWLRAYIYVLYGLGRSTLVTTLVMSRALAGFLALGGVLWTD